MGKSNVIERYTGKVEMICDGCGESSGVYTSDEFDAMLLDVKEKGWRHQKIKGEWNNFCDTCSHSVS